MSWIDSWFRDICWWRGMRRRDGWGIRKVDGGQDWKKRVWVMESKGECLKIWIDSWFRDVDVEMYSTSSHFVLSK